MPPLFYLLLILLSIILHVQYLCLCSPSTALTVSTISHLIRNPILQCCLSFCLLLSPTRSYYTYFSSYYASLTSIYYLSCYPSFYTYFTYCYATFNLLTFLSYYQSYYTYVSPYQVTFTYIPLQYPSLSTSSQYVHSIYFTQFTYCHLSNTCT